MPTFPDYVPFRVEIELVTSGEDEVGRFDLKNATQLLQSENTLDCTDANGVVVMVPWVNIAYVIAHPAELKLEKDSDAD